MARMKSLTVRGGSRSCSDSISTQVISMAPTSPGEQGVNFSTPSTLTYPRERKSVSRHLLYMDPRKLDARELANEEQDQDQPDIPFYNVLPSGSS